MGTLVYLRPLPAPRATDTAPQPENEGEYFWVPLLVLWLGSVARVGLALAHGAAFEAEATLALACVIVLPLAALGDWQHQRARPPQGMRGHKGSRLSAVR